MTARSETDVYQIAAAYLERLGVPGLRQPHDPDRVNKAAVVRCLLAEKLQEALNNPPPVGAVQRAGPARQQPHLPALHDLPAIRRSGRGTQR